ncbi:uncharacterized protein LOC124286592 isoform X2 [Haliotis rubra]|uniref:uncharacterized protein LOC124286592 isoform X2 n=1 Tax=Haliotis rubra TaxID=36100 RepID=UPI001EE50E90|nr:uncharacterized protein LOC124286592 isoform X2 [Haliotis rubra]
MLFCKQVIVEQPLHITQPSQGETAMFKKEFRYGRPFTATDEMKRSFDEAGFVIIRGLLDKDEVGKLTKSVETNEAFSQHAFNLDDGAGRKSRMVAWDHPGSDVTGILARSARVIKTCEKVLKGSHKCGRIDHCVVGGQTGADLERVSQLKTVCPLEYVEMEPGDALFFHANLLHSSTANNSDRRRWAYVMAINTKHNNPVKKHHHPQYTKLDIVDDSALKACENYYDMTGKDFMNPATSKTIKAET